MAIDRATALKNAEKLLRLGKLDAAITEYERVVEDQPRDWTTLNALGDLYVRTGNTERGIELFQRVADAYFADGFLPKASALYKKILKLQPNHEAVLIRSGEIAATQGLMADARAQFGLALEHRRARADVRGVAEMRVRLGALDGADLETRIAGARARVELGEVAKALSDLMAIAGDLSQKGKTAEAIDVLQQAASLDATDAAVRQQLARLYAAAGDVERAVESLGAGGSAGEPQDRDTLVEFAMASEAPEPGFQILTPVIERALAGGEVEWVSELLARFSERHGGYIPALVKHVEVCIDGRLEASMYDAQARLADAYIADGKTAEARFLAEDLVTHEPDNPVHLVRLRRLLELEGEADPDAVIAERLAGAAPETPQPAEPVAPAQSSAPPIVETSVEVPGPSNPPPQSLPPAIPAPPPAAPPRAGTKIVRDEIDLSAELEDILRGAMPSPPIQSDNLESVFELMREEAAKRPSVELAQEEYRKGQVLQSSGDIAGAVEAFRTASRTPALRFAAASALARIFREEGQLRLAVEWFERGLEAPAPAPEDAHALLYDLADALEADGEVERALAVCLELQSDAGAFRDVSDRIERLTRLQSQG